MPPMCCDIHFFNVPRGNNLSRIRAAGIEPAWLSDVRCCEGVQLLGILVRGYAIFPIKHPVNPFTACGGCKWKIFFLLLFYIPHCGHAAFVDLPAVLLPLFWGQFFQFVCLLFLFVVNGTDNIHAYHLTSAIIMIFKMCLAVPVSQSFIIQR